MDCIKDRDMIIYLAGVANAQKQNFVTIYPWQKSCSKNHENEKIYVALDNENICGWMQVFYRKTNVKPTQNYAYINELSTNQDRTKYKGIGSALINRLVAKYQILSKLLEALHIIHISNI